jgi:hypothetical protein
LAGGYRFALSRPVQFEWEWDVSRRAENKLAVLARLAYSIAEMLILGVPEKKILVK